MAAANDARGFQGKLPPQNLEAEMGVIGSVLLMADAIDDLGDLRPEHFYADRHEKMFEAFTHLRGQGANGIDAVTLAEELDRRKQLDEIGGVEYLAKILETVPNAAHAKYYANIVMSRWRSRQAVYGATELLDMIYSGGHDDEDIAAKAEKMMSAIAENASEAKDVSIADVLGEVWQSIQTRLSKQTAVGTPTGFTDLDNLLVGVLESELVILAARPAMGKTAFVCALALDFVRRQLPVLFLSLEMGKLEIGERLLCIESGVSGDDLKRGKLTGNAMEVEMKTDDLLRAAGRIQEMPLRIDDLPNQRVHRIAATARRMKRKHGLELLVIDYLQLIEPDDSKRDETREREVATITRKLKGLAKELRIPIMLLAQLNRGVENREDKRPRLADLRESGAIEQDADVVMFLHRPEAYDPADRPGECDVIVSKNRRGKIGTATLAWRAESTSFRDMAAKHHATADAASSAFPKRQSRDWDR